MMLNLIFKYSFTLSPLEIYFTDIHSQQTHVSGWSRLSEIIDKVANECFLLLLDDE